MAYRGRWVGTGRMDVSKRGSSWPGADRRGRRYSKGVSVWHPGLGLNRVNRILISTSYNFFSRNSLQRNFGLSVLGPEWYEDGWLTGKSFPGAHEWGQSAQKRLLLVCGASLEILESCRGNRPRPLGGWGVTLGKMTSADAARKPSTLAFVRSASEILDAVQPRAYFLIERFPLCYDERRAWCA
jgi:hypothetical protein